MRDLELRKSAG